MSFPGLANLLGRRVPRFRVDDHEHPRRSDLRCHRHELTPCDSIAFSVRQLSCKFRAIPSRGARTAVQKTTARTSLYKTNFSPDLDGSAVEKRKKPVPEGPCADDGSTASVLGPFGYRLLNEAAGRHTVCFNTLRLVARERRAVWASDSDAKQEQSKTEAGSPRNCDVTTAGRLRSSARNTEFRAARNGPSADGKCWQRIKLRTHGLNR